tara:strand:- start:140 stop:1399 length:1260 start_codon:yes stop_codon:yes gene_type:complete
MGGPTFSEDGYWMWTGNDWIPAPPQSEVLDSSSLDTAAIQSAAGNAGISQASLTNAAPYFDINSDRTLQSNELQQAVNYVSNPVPNLPYPQQYPGSNSHVAVHQQYAALQTRNMNPIIYNPSFKKSNSDNTANTVVGVCMIALAIVLASVGTYAYTSSSASPSVGDAGLDIDEVLDDINLDSDYDGIDDGYDSCPNGVTAWTSSYSTDMDGDGCKDSSEDDDDDDDGKSDWIDDCPKGYTGWTSNSYSDFDGDGCKDSIEDEDDDNDGYSDSNDWYDSGNGAISLRLTQFTAWSNGYYDGDGSNPDVYAYIGVDSSCSSSTDFTYYTYSVHKNSYDISDWHYSVHDFSESATTVCISVQLWDDDATSDDQLDYAPGSGQSYYWTMELDEGQGSFTKSYDNRGENDVSVKLELEFSRINY